MKIHPLTNLPLAEGTIVILKESAVSCVGNTIVPRRLRKVLAERESSVFTHTLSEYSNYGEWDREDIEGYIEKEDVDKFIMWEALSE